MKSSHVVALIASICTLMSNASAQIYSNASNLPILDGPVTVSTINVSGFVGNVTQMRLLLNIEHTFLADLDIILIPPGGGRYFVISTDNGGDGNNITFATVSNNGPGNIAGIGSPWTPNCESYFPEGGTINGWNAPAPYDVASLGTPFVSFASYNGRNPNGTWTLVIDDDQLLDTGDLRYWSLNFGPQADPVTANPIVFNAKTFANAGSFAPVVAEALSGCNGFAPAFASVAGQPLQRQREFAEFWSAAVPIPADTPIGPYSLEISALAAGNPEVVIGTSTAFITITPPAPPCPLVHPTRSLTGMISTSRALGPFRNFGSPLSNTIVPVSFSEPGQASALLITGQLAGSLINSDAIIRVTAPSGNTHTLQPFPTGASSSVRDLTTPLQLTFPTPEAITGTWFIETTELFNDDGIDGTWTKLCVGWITPFQASDVDPVIAGLSSVPTSITLSVTPFGGSGDFRVSANGADIGIGTLELTDPDGDGTYTHTLDTALFPTARSYNFPWTAFDGPGEQSTTTGNITAYILPSLRDIGTPTEGFLAANQPLAPGEVRWFKFSTCPSVSSPRFLDLQLTPANPAALTDTEIGLYNSQGQLLATDDNNGFGAGSVLSFGSGNGSQIGGEGLSDLTPVFSLGLNGSLGAGEYYIAITQHNAIFSNDFNVTTTSTTPAIVTLRASSSNLTCPVPCDSIDFNNNAVFPEDQDVIDFFSVLAGGDCSLGNLCNDIDFNNNQVFPEDADVIDFFTVLAGGTC